MKSILDLDDNEFQEFVIASQIECGQCIIDNARGSDDSRDYSESAADIVILLRSIDHESDLREHLDKMFTASASSPDNAYNQFASDSIPSIWNEYIVNDPSDVHVRDYPITD